MGPARWGGAKRRKAEGEASERMRPPQLVGLGAPGKFSKVYTRKIVIFCAFFVWFVYKQRVSG